MPKSASPEVAPAALRPALLQWYDTHRRDLPFRAGPGATPDPYLVWLAEIMLQQTTVAAATPRILAFAARWPTVDALAAAPVDAVLAAWAGLGYYARARNLHRCAQVISETRAGAFPTTVDGLAALPGVGAYTAAAVAAIAFDRPVVPLDANVERVVARLFAEQRPLPAVRPRLRELAQQFAGPGRNGDTAQALMDLGSMVCMVRSPQCRRCPLVAGCAAAAQGIAETLPVKAAKAPRPQRHGWAFGLWHPAGLVLVRRRPPCGLLGGMLELPGSDWRVGAPDPLLPPVAGDWRVLPAVVDHGFTHFALRLQIATVQLASVADAEAAAAQLGGGFATPDGLALPTVMRKVLTAMLAPGEPPHVTDRHRLDQPRADRAASGT